MRSFIFPVVAMVFFLTFTTNISAQNISKYLYAPSASFPYGKLNPAAPKEVANYSELIGTCNCKSFSKNQDGSWADPVNMQWTFKYIMNGTAIQDETLKEDQSHTGSIRQFNQDSSTWYVHYFRTKNPTPKLQIWEGGRINNEIKLSKPQKAPNGTDGFYNIRFYDITEKGFHWIGSWSDKKENGNINFELWKIECAKS